MSEETYLYQDMHFVLDALGYRPDEIDEDEELLYLMYALLLRAKRGDITPEDIHTANAIWYMRYHQDREKHWCVAPFAALGAEERKLPTLRAKLLRQAQVDSAADSPAL